MGSPGSPPHDFSYASSVDLAAVLDCSPEAVLHLDRAGRFTMWNRPAQRMFGRSDREIKGSSLSDSLVEEDLERWAAMLADARDGARSEGVRLDLRRPDGQIVHVSVTVTPIRTPDGAPGGSWVGARDLTEQLLAQQTLADNEERMRRSEALAGAGSFVVGLDASTAQWSHGMYAIFGFDPLDFEPSLPAYLALVQPEDRDAVEHAFRVALSGAGAVELDHRLVRPDGSVVWVFLAVEPTRDLENQIIGASGICQDVTQRRDAEAAAQAALQRERAAIEELRRVDGVRKEFLATVSHELRTPLTSILGFAALLRGLATEHGELLDPIERNARAMHQMIERLLDYSRLEAGGVTIKPRHVLLAGSVRGCVHQLEPVLGDRPLVVDVDETLTVWADPDALERILVNLMGNAAKYSAASSPIFVSTEQGRHGVTVSVADRGPGVPQEHRAQIFERFFQLPGRTAGTPGTGVGLAIVRQYVELHGGHVWVQDAAGSGADFRFDLPAGPTADE
jgi:PAS domain S-box-containing protein